MKIVTDWIKAIRKDYKNKSPESIKKDISIVTQLMIKGNKNLSPALPKIVREEWAHIMPRLKSLHRNLLRRKDRMTEQGGT
jgi:hypothetical protein